MWRGIRALPTNWLAFATVIVAAVSMAEIDRMLAQFITPAGESYSLSAATGLPPAVGAWFGWLAIEPQPMPLILLHAGWDIAFASGYTFLGFRLYRAIGWHRGAWWWAALLAVEICESGLEMVLAGRLADGGGLEPAVWFLAAASWVKWLLLAFLLVAPLFPKDHRLELGRLIARWFQAFRPHAPQLIGIIAIGVFALVPKPNLFDQYPDVVRMLVVDSQLDWRTVVDGFVGFGYLAIAAFALGRFATHARSKPVPVRGPARWPWLIVPIVVVATVALALVSRQPLEFQPPRIFVFASVIGLPLLVVFVGWVRDARSHRRAGATHTRSATPPAPADLGSARETPVPEVPVAGEGDVARIRRAGDLTAGLVLLVLGAGLVRAFTAPVALTFVPVREGVPEYRTAETAAAESWAMALLMTGVFVALLLPKFLAVIVPRAAAVIVPRLTKLNQTFEARRRRRRAAKGMEEKPAPTEHQRARDHTLIRMLIVFTSAAVLLAWGFFPTWFAGNVGPVVTIDLLVLLIVVIVWALQSEVRARRPNRFFDWMGFHRDPVLLLTVLVPLVLVLIPPERGLHPIQEAGEQLPEERTPISEAVGEWNKQPVCDVAVETAEGEAFVRPMLLVAAEGGGIRAAAWTSRVVDQLVKQAECDDGLVFLSSGVSGGSVGLTLSALASRDEDDTEGTPGFALTRKLAGWNPLSADLGGLLVGDLAAAVSGIRVATDGYRGDDGELIWQDRAADLQWWWIKKVDALKRAYDDQRRDAVGWMVLNSSAVGYECRVVISQLDLELDTRTVTDPSTKAVIPSCSGSEPGVANAIDLHELYGSCPLKLDWATAALLSARFPIVSPAGRTAGVGDDCAKLPDVQLADGGIVDNSGLATIADLTPEVMEAVREANARVEVSSAKTPWIVPIVVYISNSPGGDVSAAQADPWTDIKIAIDAQGAGQYAQNSDRAWLQRIASQTSTPCPASAAACAAAAEVVRERVGLGVAVVAPRTTPTVSSPLGWALSDVSLSAIDREVRRLAAKGGEYWPTCYGELAHVVDVLNANPLTSRSLDEEKQTDAAPEACAHG